MKRYFNEKKMYAFYTIGKLFVFIFLTNDVN